MDAVKRNPRRVAAAAVVLAVLLVAIVLIVMYLSDSNVYDEPEVFQISAAGQGYGADGVFDGDARADLAADLGKKFGTEYTVPSRDEIAEHVADGDAQWCSYGWTGANDSDFWESWPACRRSDAAPANSACCPGGNPQATADPSDMSPQPGVFMYGRKPRAGEMPLCTDSNLAAGTQCISNWASGDGVASPQYSMYD